jgi:hypothetical protein
MRIKRFHIGSSRVHYVSRNDLGRLSFNTACELGFRESLDEWKRLMGAVARR